MIINKSILIKRAHLLAEPSSVLGDGELLVNDDTPRYELGCNGFPVCIYKIQNPISFSDYV